MVAPNTLFGDLPLLQRAVSGPVGTGVDTVPNLASRILALGEQLAAQHELEVGNLRTVIESLTGENEMLQYQLSSAKLELQVHRRDAAERDTDKDCTSASTPPEECHSEQSLLPQEFHAEHSLQPLVRGEDEIVLAPPDAEEGRENDSCWVDAEVSMDLRPQVQQLVDVYVPGPSSQALMPLPRKGISSIFGPGFHVLDESSIDSPEFGDPSTGFCVPKPRLLRSHTAGQGQPINKIIFPRPFTPTPQTVTPRSDLQGFCRSRDARDLSATVPIEPFDCSVDAVASTGQDARRHLPNNFTRLEDVRDAPVAVNESMTSPMTSPCTNSVGSIAPL